MHPDPCIASIVYLGGFHHRKWVLASLLMSEAPFISGSTRIPCTVLAHSSLGEAVQLHVSCRVSANGATPAQSDLLSWRAT